MSPDTPIVYIVDDDIGVRDAIQGLLASEGWRSESFESPQAFRSEERRVGKECW